MALQKQVFSLPMSLGIDTENAAPLIDNQRFAFLSNVVFNKDNNGQLHKRSGHNPLPRTLQGGGLLPAAQLLAIFNDETCALAGGSLYGYSSQAQNWTNRGAPPMVQQVETNIAGGAFSVKNQDAVILGGVGYYSYEMNGQSWVKVVDDTNKSIKATIKLSGGSMANFTPKLVSNGTNVIALSTTAAGVMWACSINPTTYAATFTALVSPMDVIVSETFYDAQVIAGVLYVAYIGGSTVKATSWTVTSFATFTFIANANVSSAGSVVAPLPVSCATMGTNLCVTWQASNGQISSQVYTSSAFAAGTLYTPAPAGTAAAPRLATAGIATTAGNYVAVFYEQAPVSPAILSSIYYVQVGGSPTPVLWTTGSNISGLPFQNGSASNPNIYLPVVYPSLVQQTLFLTYQAFYPATAGQLAQCAGRYFSSNDAGAAPSNFRIAQSFATSAGQSLPVVVQPEGTAASSVSASLSELSLSFSVEMNSAQLGGDQHLALGSMLMDYDGTNLVEHNFHLFPETPTIGYLTSQLAIITDSYDPICATNAASQSTFRIAVPDNAANPGGPVGQLITPGEYIVFNALSEVTGSIGSTATQFIVYFAVNGNPATNPTFTGTTNVFPCVITSTMNATQIATALYNTLINQVGGFVTGQYTVTLQTTTQASVYTPQYVKLVGLVQPGTTPVAITPPVLSKSGTGTQAFVGLGAKQGVIGLSFPPASLISSGQYSSFTSQSNYAWPSGATTAQVYVWFNNSANATAGNETLAAVDPQPFGQLANKTTLGGNTVTYSGVNGNYVGVEVTLPAGISEQSVAGVVLNALNAIQPMFFSAGFASFSQLANEVLVATGTTGITALPQAQWASPSPLTIITGGTGQGYVGIVVNNQTGYDAIEYSSVYEWIDSQNQLHQSAPSIPAIAYIPVYQATGGGSIPAGSASPVSAVIQISTQPLSLTLKTSANNGMDLDIAIYRTISGATVGNQVFYRVTPSTAPLLNVPNQTTAITYADFSSDTGVQSNQTLYTTGGVQPNAAPPACSYVLNHQNRIWLAGLENPNELWYSETWEPGFAVNFTSAQQAILNPVVGQAVGGPIVALASMDSYLIIFQENQIWYIQGYGPDPTGGNGFFSPPQIVASSSQIGCRDPQSVVLMPNGVMFKSTQGFWLLGRDLQLRYVGAAVKSFNADVVTSSAALANNSQINFLSNSGTTLMYDWYYDSWATFTTTGLDSVLDATGTFNMITSSGAIWYQVNGQYIDGDGSPVLMGITTAWLKPQNIQGFQRIWRVLLEGLFYGSQQYLITVAYNYGAVVDTFPVFVGAGGAQVGVWGQSATWGEFPWGEDAGSTTTYANQIQLRVDNSNQLCESLQLSITDLPPVPVNQTWSLNALDLVIGVRSGGMKRIGPPQSVG